MNLCKHMTRVTRHNRFKMKMAQIPGTYELVISENFAEFLADFDKEISEEVIKRIEAAKSVVTVEVEGDKYTITSQTGSKARRTTFASGDKFDEQGFNGRTFSCSAIVTGSQIKISSTSNGGNGERIFDFNEYGVTITYTTSVSDIVANRFYKRL